MLCLNTAGDWRSNAFVKKMSSWANFSPFREALYLTFVENIQALNYCISTLFAKRVLTMVANCLRLSAINLTVKSKGLFTLSKSGNVSEKHQGASKKITVRCSGRLWEVSAPKRCLPDTPPPPPLRGQSDR